VFFEFEVRNPVTLGRKANLKLSTPHESGMSSLALAIPRYLFV
jgi:hypothetical protein